MKFWSWLRSLFKSDEEPSQDDDPWGVRYDGQT